MSSLAFLPPEVMLEAFAFVANESLNDAVTLTLISSEVRRRTARYLYRTIVLRSAHQVNAFLALLTSHIEPAYYPSLVIHPGLYVRSLCVTHHALGSPSDPLSQIFDYCRKVERVALQSTLLHSSLVSAHAIHRLRCSDVTVIGPTWPSDWKRHARVFDRRNGSEEPARVNFELYPSPSYVNAETTTILGHTTHLRLNDPFSSPHNSIPHLCSLPKLSHIAVHIHERNYDQTTFNDLDPLLSSSKIKMVVAIFDFRTWKSKRYTLDDWARLAEDGSNGKLFVVERKDDNPVSDWISTVKGNESIWSRAKREQEHRLALKQFLITATFAVEE